MIFYLVARRPLQVRPWPGPCGLATPRQKTCFTAIIHRSNSVAHWLFQTFEILFRDRTLSKLHDHWPDGVGDPKNRVSQSISSINMKTSLSNSIDLSISSKIPNQKIFSRRSAARLKTFVEFNISKNSFCPRKFSIVLTDFFFITWQWTVLLYPFVAMVDF